MSMHKKPLTMALGAAFALAGTAQAGSLFQATDLNSGYQVAAIGDKAGEAKCGEAKCGAEHKCGADKKAEHKCGEAKCGADKPN